nr:immunoglobulin light chain junction region [Macaca mulatta]
CQHYYYYPYSF